MTHIQAAWVDIDESTINGAWKKVWPECNHNTDGFGEPAVEGCVEVHSDVAELVRLGEDVMAKAPIELLTFPNLQKVLEIFEDSIAFQQNIHANCERGSLMRRDV
jgi:hypothetical protein